MKTIRIYIVTALFLLISMSCNREKELDTRYFNLKYPSQWESEKIMNTDDAISGYSFINGPGKNPENIAFILYMNQVADPEYMIYIQIKEKTNPIMRTARSGDITDTLFNEIPAKKAKFTKAMQNGILLSGEILCFVKDGTTYIINDIYPESKPENAGRGLEMFQKIHFKNPPKRNDDIYAILKELEKTQAKLIPCRISDNAEMTGFTVEKGKLIYSYKVTNINKEMFHVSGVEQWKATSKPLVLEELKKSRNTVEIIRKAMDANYTFIYKYHDRFDRFLFEVTLTEKDYNK